MKQKKKLSSFPKYELGTYISLHSDFNDCIRNGMKECRKLITMRCYDISSRYCRPPGGSKLSFIILSALILDIILQHISVLGHRKG